MNLVFWGLMLLMLLVAIGIIIFPLLRVRDASSFAYRDSNLQLYEDKISELDADLSEDRIDQEQYKVARKELDRELLEDVPIESQDTAAVHYSAQAKRHPALALSVAVFLPGLALLVYLQLGMHAASENKFISDEPQLTVTDVVLKLEKILSENKGTEKEWSILGRAYKHQGRFEDAAKAFAEAVVLNPSAQLMLEQAEAIALANDQTFDATSRTLVLKALEQEPDNINVLWFAGVAEYQTGNFRKSIEYLSRLSSAASNDKEIHKSIRLYIEKAREQLVAKGEQVQSVDEILQTSATTDAPGARIELRVGISDEVRNRFNNTDAVFVYAKAQQGPKMPLAVQRMTLAELPATVVLNDNMAMVEGMNLSAFGSVKVYARVTKSGSAIAISGDYIGEILVDDVTSSKIFSIIIEKAVP